MKWTGLGTIACAAMLTVACAGDGRSDRDDDDRSVVTGRSEEDTRRSAGVDDDDLARLGPTDDNRSMVGTSGTAQIGASEHGANGDARHFVQTAAVKSNAEVQLGQLASEHAQSAEVKQFAQMMVRDHTKAGNELEQAVRGENIDTSGQMDQKHTQLMDRLKTLRGAEFDREYMKAMIEGHREMRSMVAQRADGGRVTSTSRTPGAAGTSGTAGSNTQLDTAVNQWASKALPTVEQHLQKAEQIYGSLD